MNENRFETMENTQTSPEVTLEEVTPETPTATPANKEENKPVGFWAYFGLILLFSIPVIGFLAALGFIIGPKNKNIKNFAGASLTWIVVQIVSTVLVTTLVISALFGLFIPMINDSLGTEFQNFSEVVGVATDLAKGDYSSVIAHFVPSLTGVMGEEYRPFLEELSSGKYEDVFRQLKSGQYSTILSDLQSGSYPELVEKLDPESYNFITAELDKAAKGLDSEFFDMLDDFLP